jgi:serine/threonine-protein phosphatase 2A activator
VLRVLDTVEATAHAIPPVENAASRFGNPAFRTFYDRVSEVRSACINSFRIVEQVRGLQLSPSLHATLSIPADARDEVGTYFVEAWGNRTRIDYGSGMELNFLCWLCVFPCQIIPHL